MTIPTEPIGSIPRPPALIKAVAAGEITDPNEDPRGEKLAPQWQHVYALPTPNRIAPV